MKRMPCSQRSQTREAVRQPAARVCDPGNPAAQWPATAVLGLRLVNRCRRGSVLVVVLILVVLLSLATYSYTELMVTEYSASTMYGRRIQTQAFADSAS